MTTSKDPSYPWYPRDAIADFEKLSADAELCARRLLDFQWLEGGLPAEPRRLALLNRKLSPARWRRAWAEIEDLFPVADRDPTQRLNRRLERVRNERETFQEGQSLRGKAGAERRWRELRNHGGATPNGDSAAMPAPDGGAIISPMANDMAEAMPKHGSASASASASTSSVNSARADLIRRLAGEPARHDAVVFLENLPKRQSEFIWLRILLACLDGDGMPNGQPATTAALMAACREFPALGGEQWAPRHFRGCVAAAMREAQRLPRRPGDPAVTTAAASEGAWLEARRRAP